MFRLGLAVPVLSVLLLSACTSVTVRPVDPNLSITHVCILENPKVKVSDLLGVLQEGFRRNGIETSVLPEKNPKLCEYYLTYTAFRSWDMAPYLIHAELRLEKDDRQIGYAEYHLEGKGGLSLTKWQGTATKLDPVIDELLKKPDTLRASPPASPGPK